MEAAYEFLRKAAAEDKAEARQDWIRARDDLERARIKGGTGAAAVMDAKRDYRSERTRCEASHRQASLRRASVDSCSNCGSGAVLGAWGSSCLFKWLGR